jgi:DNA-binding NarL/FixJ family response regulator
MAVYNPDTSNVNYRDKVFLVIDDQSGTRQSLRTTIQNMGGVTVNFGANYKDAITKLKVSGKAPDIILCDFNLEEGRDGQQLFEEMRKTKLIYEHTIFIMVTAERSYENVMSVAELSPDDYILKPFTPDMLHLRLNRVAAKKIFLKHFYIAKLKKDLDGALGVLDHLENTQEGSGIYRFTIKRLRAETLLEANRTAEAYKHYEAIRLIHPFPWAMLGSAKALVLNKQLPQAQKLIDEVIESSPDYLSAFDIKAEVCQALGNFAEAQKVLQETVNKNPRNWGRKKTLVEAAILNGDVDTVKSVMSDLLQNSLVANDSSIADRLNLARIAVRGRSSAMVTQALSSITSEVFEKLDEHDRICVLSLRASAFPAEHGEELARHRSTIISLATPSKDLGIDVVRAGLAIKDIEMATRMAAMLLKNQETKSVSNELSGIFTTAKQKAAFDEVLRQIA